MVVCDLSGQVRAESAGVGDLLSRHGIRGPLAPMCSDGSLREEGELILASADGTSLRLRKQCHGDGDSIIVELSQSSAETVQPIVDRRSLYRLRGVAKLAPDLAHEARNTATSLVYNQHILGDGQDLPDEMRRSCLEEMSVATRQLDRLISSILEYAAPPHVAANRTSVDETLATLLILLRNKFRKKNRPLSIAVEEEQLVAAIHPFDLQLILVELIIWAAGAPDDNVQVALRVVARASTIDLSVVAEGRSATGDEAQLSAARWVTEQAGGTMEIIGEGSEVRVSIAKA